MGKFMRALEKAGLVRLEEGADALSAELSPAPPEELAPSPVQEILSADECNIAEQQPLESVYRARGVPPSQFPAEKMLKLLDGLKAMDPATRKTAVHAMDAADDTWTIEDAVLDAQRKIKALEEESAHLARQASGAEANGSEELRRSEEQQQAAVAAIRRQIQDLEKLLEREVEKATAEKAQIQARVKAANDACARETARLAAEIGRLREILGTFAAPTSPPVSRTVDTDKGK
jgi:hypothetical protein